MIKFPRYAVEQTRSIVIKWNLLNWATELINIKWNIIRLFDEDGLFLDDISIIKFRINDMSYVLAPYRIRRILYSYYLRTLNRKLQALRTDTNDNSVHVLDLLKHISTSRR